jgi:putative IMPACT (imprinted ancient) family translation regulator
LDLVVFPRRVDGDRYVGEVVELLTESEYADLDTARARCGTIEKDETTVYWNTVAWRDTEGNFHVAYDNEKEIKGNKNIRFRFFDRLAERTDRTVDEVEAEFQRKHRYVQYMAREEMNDFEELFAFLADLRNDEAATVERATREEA